MQQGTTYKLTLNFKDPNLEEEYREHHYVKHRGVARVILVAALFFIAAFAYTDKLLVPENFIYMRFARFFVAIPVTIATLVLSFLPTIRKWWDAIFSLFVVVIFSCFLLISALNNLEGILLPQKLTLVIIVTFFIAGIRFAFGCAVAIAVFSIYAVYILLTQSQYSLIEHSSLQSVVFLLIFFAVYGGYILEKYSRTEFVNRKIIDEERQKSEQLLLNILPQTIAEELKKQPGIIANKHKKTTILFADIVGFTGYSSKMSPEELVKVLNAVFSIFDYKVEEYGLEKIKTIGDAYMVASGVPDGRRDHAENIADFAIDIEKKLKDFNRKSGYSIELRIGIHAGDLVAGVIGVKKFSYDVWGETVNIASRMESQGVPGEIQVSEDFYELLKETYEFERRGTVEIKGKGPMITYFLRGKRVPAAQQRALDSH